MAVVGETTRTGLFPVRLACWAAAFVVAGYAGRLTIIDGGTLSLIWPAAGIAVLWIALGTPRSRPWDVGALGLSTFLINWMTGASAGLALVFVVTNVLQSVLVVAAARRMLPNVWGLGGAERLHRLGGLGRLCLAAVAPCLLTAVLGSLGLLVTTGSVELAEFAVWWGRNTVGVITVATLGLLVGPVLVRARQEHAWAPLLRRIWPVAPLHATEGIALVVATVLLDLAFFTSPGGRPVSFLLLVMSVWAGLRFSPVAVALHGIGMGGAGIAFTLADKGQFAAIDSANIQALVAQVFVAMCLLTGLSLAFSRDERDRANRELTRHRDLLASFAGVVAHDLHNPLTVVDGWSETLADEFVDGPVDPATGAPMVARVRGAAATMRALIDDLLAYTVAGEQSLTPQPIDLEPFVGELADLHGSGPARPVIVAEGPLDVLADPRLARQLLSNLVGNAVKYVGPGTRPDVVVRGRPVEGRMLEVSVVDNGIGIPPSERANVFEELHRLNRDGYHGTGLGLAICRRVVERHGGTIRAEANPAGDGTRMVFTLPRAGLETG